MTQYLILCFEFINRSWYLFFEFIDFRPGRDFFNGRGLLIQGGDYTYICICICIYIYIYICIEREISLSLSLAQARLSAASACNTAQGKRFHTGNRKGEITWGNATESPLDNSSENPLDKWQSFGTYRWKVKLCWKMPLTIHCNPLDNATENPRWFLRCWFIVCNMLPLTVQMSRVNLYGRAPKPPYLFRQKGWSLDLCPDACPTHTRSYPTHTPMQWSRLRSGHIGALPYS